MVGMKPNNIKCPKCGYELKKEVEKVIKFDLFVKKIVFSIIIVVVAIITLGFVVC